MDVPQQTSDNVTTKTEGDEDDRQCNTDQIISYLLLNKRILEDDLKDYVVGQGWKWTIKARVSTETEIFIDSNIDSWTPIS